MARRKSRGRQKIPMEKISSQSALYVSFSKRQRNIFKKATELSVLTGAHVAVLIFSPSGKPYTFGHPGVEAVARKFLDLSPDPNNNQNLNEVNVSALGRVLDDLHKQLEAAKERAQVVKEKLRQLRKWWRLNDLLACLLNLQERVEKQIEELSVKRDRVVPSSSYSAGAIDLELHL